MISVDLKSCTKEVQFPFLQHFDDGEKFLFVCGVILLSFIELAGIVHNGVRCFPSFSKTQDGSRAAIASIRSDVDF